MSYLNYLKLEAAELSKPFVKMGVSAVAPVAAAAGGEMLQPIKLLQG